MKKARAWLDEHGVEYAFHDYKVEGIDKAKLAGMDQGRGLGDAAQSRRHHVPQAARRGESGLDERRAIALMLEQPSMIKRPVLERGRKLLVGFSPEKYSALK